MFGKFTLQCSLPIMFPHFMYLFYFFVFVVQNSFVGQLQMSFSHDGKVIPIVVGLHCSFNDVHAYTPILKFRDWITVTLEYFGESDAAKHIFEPSVCAERYKHLREHKNNYIDDGDFLDENDVYRSINKMPFNSHTVKLLWADELATNMSSCYGAHVEPDAIITLARCTSYLG